LEKDRTSTVLFLFFYEWQEMQVTIRDEDKGVEGIAGQM